MHSFSYLAHSFSYHGHLFEGEDGLLLPGAAGGGGEVAGVGLAVGGIHVHHGLGGGGRGSRRGRAYCRGACGQQGEVIIERVGTPAWNACGSACIKLRIRILDPH